MPLQDVLDLLIEDLRKVRSVCLSENRDEAPNAAVLYLAANHDLIDFYLKQVYTKLDMNQRGELARQHQGLDYSVVSDTFYKIPASVISLVKHPTPRPILPPVITDDDVNMILRVLQYARYCPLDAHSFMLRMSPIENHGLQKRFGDFVSLTEEEKHSVRWDISDILYHEREKAVFEECKLARLDIKKGTLTYDMDSDGKYAEFVNALTRFLVGLLKSKLDFDLAVVFMSGKNVGRYSNLLDTRFYTTYAYLLASIRAPIVDDISFFSKGDDSEDNLTSLARRVHIMNLAEKILKPFRLESEALRSEIPRLRASSEAISQARALIGPMAGPPLTIGEVMRDKYIIEGQAGAVGPGAHAHDINFQQIWKQLEHSIDLANLAEELSRLRKEMKNEAVEPEHDIAVSEIAKAEQASRSGNGAKAIEHLKSAGNWALDAATKIGTTVAAEVIKKSMGY
jgi:hypothetical protein